MTTPQSLSERLRALAREYHQHRSHYEEAADALDAKDTLLAQADRALELSASALSRTSGAMAAEDPFVTEVHQIVCVTLAAIRASKNLRNVALFNVIYDGKAALDQKDAEIARLKQTIQDLHYETRDEAARNE